MNKHILYALLALGLAGCGGADDKGAKSSSQTSVPVQDFVARLNDTGVTGSAGLLVSNASTCEATATGLQDCMIGRDVDSPDNDDGLAGFSFTKIGADGKDLPAAAPQWSCVRDNVTGLMWEVKTSDGGLRDLKWNYTSYDSRYADSDGTDSTLIADAGPYAYSGGTDRVWAGPVDTGAGSGRDDCGNASKICTTSQYTKDVNAGAGLCGHTDWRMPQADELRSLLNFSQPNQAGLDAKFFNSNVGAATKPFYAWSDTPVANVPGAVWALNMKYAAKDSQAERSAYRYNDPSRTLSDRKAILVRNAYAAQ